MRRVFWLALGLGAGSTAAVLVSRWVRRKTQKLAPANVGRQARGLVADLASLAGQAVAEFKKGKADKEAELRASLGE